VGTLFLLWSVAAEIHRVLAHKPRRRQQHRADRRLSRAGRTAASVRPRASDPAPRSALQRFIDSGSRFRPGPPEHAKQRERQSAASATSGHFVGSRSRRARDKPSRGHRAGAGRWRQAVPADRIGRRRSSRRHRLVSHTSR